MKQKLLFFLVFFNATLQAQSLQDRMEEIRQVNGIPQLSYAAIAKDSILTLGTTGYHKSTSTDPLERASLDDYFHLGSNTKAITAFLAATLVEKGVIDWTTTYFDLYPEAKENAHPAYLQASLQDFLSHRAKVPPYTSGTEKLNLPSFSGDKQQQRNAFAEYVLRQSPIETTTGYAYSNAGYTLAAVMLEKVTHRSWEQLLKNLLMEQLAIDFAFGWPNRNFDQQPWGHLELDGELTPIPPTFDYNLSLIEPAGDLSMNINNYIRYIQLNLEGLNHIDNILPASRYADLFTRTDSYAFGWAVLANEQGTQYEHAGSDGTFFSYCLLDPTANRAYIVLANSATAQTQEGIQQAFALLRELD